MTRLVYYILDAAKNPVPETDALRWAAWFEDVSKRRVASTEFGSCWVSTVFIGLDHNFTKSGRPLLFENMVFGADELGGLTERSCTWGEAEEAHCRVCERVSAMVAAAEAEAARVLS